MQVGLLLHKRRSRARARPCAFAPRRRPRAALPRRPAVRAHRPPARRRSTEIDADLRRPTPMRRLLQGDVGSGKTVVALYALLRAVEAGHQGAVMAPTETLAEQHLETIARARRRPRHASSC